MSRITVEALRWLLEPRATQDDARVPVLIDVREPHEFAAGHIRGALSIPLATLQDRVGREVPEARSHVVVYCSVGPRAEAAQEALVGLGYKRAVALSPGYVAWNGSLERAPESSLSAQRYARQRVLPEVGEAGQEKLRTARILLVGLGGLGSPVALYLAAAGVGTLGLSDGDEVDLSNLHRQVLHTTGRVGRKKTDSARRAILDLNPEVAVLVHDAARESNVDLWLTGSTAYDLVVDGSDNLRTRYLLSDAAFRHGRPLVHGAVHRFEGQVTTLLPAAAAARRGLPAGPCYRCIFPESPDAGLSPSCADAGVLGATCGVVGSLMGAEALKLVLGVGSLLSRTLLLYDGLAPSFHRMQVEPSCPRCVATG